MKIYRTKSGDMWDGIAFQQLGSCKWTERLIDANRDKIETFIFKAGVELKLPDVSTVHVASLPPWRR